METGRKDIDPEGKSRNRSERNFVRRVFVAVLVISAFALVVYALKFFLLVFAGILLGVFFSAIAGFLSKHTFLNRGIALALGIILTVGGVFAAFWFLAPRLYHEADEVYRAVTISVEKISDRVDEYTWGSEMMSSIRGVEGEVMAPDRYWSRFKGFFSTTLGVLADFLIILITGVFLAADPDLYRNGFVRMFPVHSRGRVLEILDMSYRTLRLWLVGKFASMGILGVLFFTGLMILDMPMAFALALMSALLAFIPNIGGYLGGVISVLVGFTQGTDLALHVLLLYIFIQFLEDYFITPVINKRMIELPPALTLFWLVLLGLSSGILGLFMAAPLLAIILIVIREIYVKDHLERRVIESQ